MPILFTADPAKIRDYLLNEEHPQNGGKAVFLQAFGFSRDNWVILARALTAEASVDDVVVSSRQSQHGVKFVVDRLVRSPDGRNPWMRTVWISDAEVQGLRLVTAYPIEPRS